MENVRALYNERTRYNLSRWHHVVRGEVLREMLGAVFVNGANKLVLDVGCGDGWYSSLLVELGFQVIGLDVSSSSLPRGKRRLRNAEFVSADANHLPFRPEIFDLVVAAQFLEHIEQPNRIVAILSESIKPIGRLMVETPCSTNLVDQLLRKLLRTKIVWGLTIDRTHKHFFSLTQLIEIVGQPPLQIEEVRGMVHLNYTLPIINRIVKGKKKYWPMPRCDQQDTRTHKKRLGSNNHNSCEKGQATQRMLYNFKENRKITSKDKAEAGAISSSSCFDQ